MGSEILQFFKRSTWKRIVIFSVLIFILYLVRSILNIILLTFIFSFLMNGLVDFISKRIRINRKIIVLLLYVAVVSILVYGVVKYLPVVINEISQLIKQLTEFYSKPQDNIVFNYIIEQLKHYEITTYLNFGMTYLIKYFSDIGSVGLQILLALILSLFFLLEKERIISFTNRFKYSKISPFYNELEYFGRKFVRTFGKVIEAQFIIATVNMAITVAGLWIMDFPQLFGLGILIFFLGLIPVAGVIISLFPLCFIAYSIGGIMKVVYVLIMIAVIHALEAYVLNPKLMSSKTNLPVFYTFIVLIFSEHFFGVWGLILGIPVFVFILDVLGVKTVQGKRDDDDE
ncbi:AI-2E family transporter [Parageobacillus thermoglucosidasius]|uniref:AI-2E family transporter n=1 Tax=Parageobacillus thermoglucosidasius TaxID=1426 RepID=UPI002E1C0F87|nr:AI-2E family transporter [Parageobacillus thermoglucosidasius]MED4913621.1 AI-2E family transporter [Parageobacillus thermoglucosidasius]MED4944983.1 AI-2E family transporter [Parageobacillus thermoglucosidasius]MED4983408.1 AI-2E family transporter [Parageobacillus thermoglucosidasius]